MVTNPRIFDPPSTTREAFQLIDALVARPQCLVTRPGPEHWSVFRRLCEERGVRGKLVADAAHAALAIETGCEWIPRTLISPALPRRYAGVICELAQDPRALTNASTIGGTSPRSARRSD